MPVWRGDISSHVTIGNAFKSVLAFCIHLNPRLAILPKTSLFVYFCELLVRLPKNPKGPIHKTDFLRLNGGI